MKWAELAIGMVAREFEDGPRLVRVDGPAREVLCLPVRYLDSWPGIPESSEGLVRADAECILEADQGYEFDLNAPDPEDTARLFELRDIIDDIGWRDEEQERGGDYAARLKEVAEELRQLRTLRNFSEGP